MFELIEISQRWEDKGVHDHEKWYHCQKYIPERCGWKYHGCVISSGKEDIEEKEEIYIFLLLLEKRIEYQNIKECDDGEYGIYDKRDIRKDIFGDEEKKEETIYYREDNTVRPEDEKDRFGLFLQEKEKYTGDDRRYQEGDVVEYFGEIGEIIDEIHTIYDSVEGNIKKKESHVIGSFFEKIHNTPYDDFLDLFIMMILCFFIILVFLLLYEKGKYFTEIDKEH